MPLPQTYPSHGMFAYGEEGHTYDNFIIFDRRSPEEKPVEKKGGTIKRFSQNQLYSYQKYKNKLKNPDDDIGGFAGLVHRANG